MDVRRLLHQDFLGAFSKRGNYLKYYIQKKLSFQNPIFRAVCDQQDFYSTIDTIGSSKYEYWFFKISR